MGMSELKVLKSFNEKFKNSENKKRKIIATKKYKIFYVIKGEGVCVSICVFVYNPCAMHAFKAEELRLELPPTNFSKLTRNKTKE